MGGIAEVLYSGENRPRLGNVVYGLFGRDFTTRDGRRTMIVVVTPRQWANLVAALGLNEAIAAVEAARGVSFGTEIGRAHVCTPVTNAHLVCPTLLEKKKKSTQRK